MPDSLDIYLRRGGPVRSIHGPLRARGARAQRHTRIHSLWRPILNGLTMRRMRTFSIAAASGVAEVARYSLSIIQGSSARRSTYVDTDSSIRHGFGVATTRKKNSAQKMAVTTDSIELNALVPFPRNVRHSSNVNATILRTQHAMMTYSNTVPCDTTNPACGGDGSRHTRAHHSRM